MKLLILCLLALTLVGCCTPYYDTPWCRSAACQTSNDCSVQ